MYQIFVHENSVLFVRIEYQKINQSEFQRQCIFSTKACTRKIIVMKIHVWDNYDSY